MVVFIGIHHRQQYSVKNISLSLPADQKLFSSGFYPMWQLYGVSLHCFSLLWNFHQKVTKKTISFQLCFIFTYIIYHVHIIWHLYHISALGVATPDSQACRRRVLWSGFCHHRCCYVIMGHRGWSLIRFVIIVVVVFMDDHWGWTMIVVIVIIDFLD